MMRTLTERIRGLTSVEYSIIREMSRDITKIQNQALGLNYQMYNENKKNNVTVKNEKTGKEYIKSPKSSEIYSEIVADSMVGNKNRWYSKSVQLAIDEVMNSLKSTMALIKKKQDGEYNKKVRFPGYKESNSYSPFTTDTAYLNGKAVKNDIENNNIYRIPVKEYYKQKYNYPNSYIEVKFRSDISSYDLRMVRINPISKNGEAFEIQFVCQDKDVSEKTHLPNNNHSALGIDPGLKHFLSCATNTGETFILSGADIKRENERFDKEHQKNKANDKLNKITYTTNKNADNQYKHLCVIRNYCHQYSKDLVDYCLENNIGTIAMGANQDFQDSPNLGKKNNKTFTNMPYGKFKNYLEYKCENAGIRFVRVNEAFTSLSSFFGEGNFSHKKGLSGKDSKDKVKNYCKQKGITLKEYQQEQFGGYRDKGVYVNNNGYELNSDINGALNMMRKVKGIDLDELLERGTAKSPKIYHNYQDFK